MDRVHRGSPWIGSTGVVHGSGPQGGPWIGSTGVVHGSGPQVWSMDPGPVFQKPINANPRLKI